MFHHSPPRNDAGTGDPICLVGSCICSGARRNLLRRPRAPFPPLPLGARHFVRRHPPNLDTGSTLSRNAATPPPRRARRRKDGVRTALRGVVDPVAVEVAPGARRGLLTEVLPVPSRAVRGSRPQPGGCESRPQSADSSPAAVSRQPSCRRLNQVGCPIGYANVQESALLAEPIGEPPR
jgi:hypothetical protein